MKNVFSKIVCKFGPQLCAFALLVSGVAVQHCNRWYYQPEEPAGLADFAARRNK